MQNFFIFISFEIRSFVVCIILFCMLHKNGQKPNLTAFCFSLAESAAYTGRVRFATSDPIADSALILMGTRSADEGKYTCKIATFPAGNFQTVMLVTVWSEYINHGYMGKQKTASFCHTVTVHILYISTVKDHHKPLLIFSLHSGRDCI